MLQNDDVTNGLDNTHRFYVISACANMMSDLFARDDLALVSGQNDRRKRLEAEHRAGVLARRPAPERYEPPEIPAINGERRIILNAETTGLQWWAGDKPIGWSYLFPESGRCGYLPMRHVAGNLSVNAVHAWLRDVRGMRVDNTNIKFDLHMARVDGVDLLDGGNTFGDAAHYAALLDDHRLKFNLDQLSKELLGWDVLTDPIGKQPGCIRDESEFRHLHPSEVAPYAVRNVEQVARLIELLQPQILTEGLERVLQLEQDVIPVVVEMEKNGTYLDLQLLADWRAAVARDREWELHFIFKETGLRIESPDSPKSLELLFRARGVPITSFTPTGAASFTDAALRGINDPCVQAMRRAGQLADLESKYLTKYAKAARSDGWLRFNLHQLKSTKGEDEYVGTVSGRFSAAGDRFGGYNPQQVVAVEKQTERGWCPDYVVRKLIVPGPGEACLYAADMMSVEYRLFAHYANSATVLAAYRAAPTTQVINGKDTFITGPEADYHAIVMNLLHTVNSSLNRKLVKNINFAKIYGAGLVKFALMLGQITDVQYKEFVGRTMIRDMSVYRDPALREAQILDNAYNQLFPEVKPLLKLARETAEHRGYVCTLDGRRARLTGRFNSALNRIIQGGAASLHKRGLVEAYKQRESLGLVMRLTVHDELLAGLIDSATQSVVDKLLNVQYFNVRVPILWESKIGANWAECK